jgi:hypothetical protein
MATLAADLGVGRATAALRMIHRPTRPRGETRRVASGFLVIGAALLFACDEREVGVPASVLDTAEAIEVRSLKSGNACRTITTPEARARVARVLARYAEWPEVTECTPFCRDVVAQWRTGRVYSGEVGVCGDRVTVHIPGPQGCGRSAPPEDANELLAALGTRQ